MKPRLRNETLVKQFWLKLAVVDTACNVGQIMLVRIGTLEYKAKINTNSFCIPLHFDEILLAAVSIGTLK